MNSTLTLTLHQYTLEAMAVGEDLEAVSGWHFS